jgi:hypothetical protein
MATRRQKEEEWLAAKKRCRLDDEEVRMAKELGIGPRSLIKNIPSRNQQWKAPVREWLRHLYSKKFEHRDSQANSSKRLQSLRDKNGAPSGFRDKSVESDPSPDIDIPF